jgi:hypothetical protein
MSEPIEAKRTYKRSHSDLNPSGLIALEPYYVDNHVYVPSDEDEEEHEEATVDLNLIEYNCDPQRLYNNPQDLAAFFEESLAPFLWWSMIANLTSWITSAGKGILDSSWFRNNGVRCLFLEALKLAFTKLPFPRIYNRIQQLLSWTGLTALALERVILPTHHWLDTPFDELRPNEPARFTPLPIYWGTVPELNTQGFILIRRNTSTGNSRGSWNWLAKYFEDLPRKCWEVCFDKITDLRGHWRFQHLPDPC